jgi:nucleotide-binding universal stress UspA family protein
MSGKRVLAAIELDGWQRTVEVANQFALALGAELVLVHVVRPMVNVYPDLPHALFTRAQHEVEVESRRALAAIAESRRLRTILRVGDPVTEILAAVAEEAPEMLVIGTHGRRGLQRLMLGSVAERVLRQCRMPVLTVAPAA